MEVTINYRSVMEKKHLNLVGRSWNNVTEKKWYPVSIIAPRKTLNNIVGN